MNLKFLVFTFLVFHSYISFSQVKIIFDTDIGGDSDDLGALAMLHTFIDRGECDLLAVMCWQTEEYAVSAIDAINRFYNHPDIPIGLRSGAYHHDEWYYNKPIADHFLHSRSNKDAENAVQLYRKILSKSVDKSIVIVTVGPLKNIQDLIESGSDEYSELNGRALIEKKVKEFVMMGGGFPESENEWNFNGDMPGVTKAVIENLSVPITFSGFEVGLVIKTGQVFNDIDPDTPLYVGYMHFSKNAPWIKANFEGKILDNASFDQTAVLYAVEGGLGKYWKKIEDGYCKPDMEGGNKWVDGKSYNHAYLKLLADPEDMAALIEKIMLNDY